MPGDDPAVTFLSPNVGLVTFPLISGHLTISERHKELFAVGFSDGFGAVSLTMAMLSLYMTWRDQSLGDHGIAVPNGLLKTESHLEDHPMTCKWLITMVRFRPLSTVSSPSKWPIFMASKLGVPN